MADTKSLLLPRYMHNEKNIINAYINTYLGEGQYFVLLANEFTKYPKIQIKGAKYLGTLP